jgi:hypothetical protein
MSSRFASLTTTTGLMHKNATPAAKWSALLQVSN